MSDMSDTFKRGTIWTKWTEYLLHMFDMLANKGKTKTLMEEIIVF